MDLRKDIIKSAHEPFLNWILQQRLQQSGALYRSTLGRAGATLGTIQGTTGSLSTASSHNLDLYAILKAHQAISSETDLERLLSVVMRIIGEVSGAEVAYLLMEERGELAVRAQFRSGPGLSPPPVAGGSQDERAAAGAGDYSEAVVRLVARTGETILLDDAGQEGEFVDDPAVRARRVRSVLCHPLREQQTRIGLIYLENNLSTHAFTPECVEVVRLLATQAAISIANAQAHARLEGLVAERTAALEATLAEVRQMAVTDELTDTYNRRHFFVLAELEFARARRYGSPLAAIMLDIDHFKQVNDTYGHATGDAVLRVIAHRYRQAIRGSDILGRYGGEEFALLLPETRGAEATEVAERLRLAVADAAVSAPGGTVPVTASLGMATLSARTPTLAALLSQADAALYQAKHSGRNRVVAYSEPRRARTSRATPRKGAWRRPAGTAPVSL